MSDGNETDPETTVIAVPGALDDLYAYWRSLVHKGLVSPTPLHRDTPQFACARCKSRRVRTTAYGDYVCSDCDAQWRPPLDINAATCPQCKSGRVVTLPYGDKKCNDCGAQWR